MTLTRLVPDVLCKDGNANRNRGTGLCKESLGYVTVKWCFPRVVCVNIISSFLLVFSGKHEVGNIPAHSAKETVKVHNGFGEEGSFRGVGY